MKSNTELNQMSAMDRFPIPQFIFWLPLVAITSSNVLREKALCRDSECSFTYKCFVFCDKRTRLSIQNYDASVLEGLT
jgi:hypothetical protein